MKFLLLGTAALTLALASGSTDLKVRVHVDKGNDAICYKACASGEYCVRGSDKCTKPPQGQCFNPATSRWIAKCDPGFTCKNGKCDYAKKSNKKVEMYDDEDDEEDNEDEDEIESKVVVKKAKKAVKGGDDICYKACASGEYCVRGSDKCAKPPQGQCFNPATSRWIAKCDPGFTCRNGKCEYAKKSNKKVELYDEDDDENEDDEDNDDEAKVVVKKAKKAVKGNDAICYKACASGEYCVRGSDKCTKPPQGQCFNPATSRWIAKCDPGFTCKNGKCDYAKKSNKKVELYDEDDDEDNEDEDENDAKVVKKAKKATKGADDICYKWCPNGQYCARGQTSCRGAQNDCFNPATSRWIAKCDPGFKCKNGKCDYAHHLGKKSLIKGPNDICYKQCASGQYCAIGDTECRSPPSGKCFNPAKSIWIDKCDPGFACKNGKCDFASDSDDDSSDDDSDSDSDSDSKDTPAPAPAPGGDEICYKQCPSGQYCARGDNQCRAPKDNCFNPATSRWVSACDRGFTCKNGKCDYARKSAKKVIEINWE